MKKTTLNKLVQYSFLLILILFLFIGGPQLFDTRSLRKLWDLGHIVLFALLFLIVLRDSNWLRDRKISIQFIIILVITIFFGLVIEWIQLLIGRTSELIDVWRNIVGTLLAFVFSKNISIVKPKIIKIARGIVLFLLLLAAWPLIKVVIDEIQAQIDFPVIADFENPFEIEKWYGHSNISLDSVYIISGSKSLKAELLMTKYSGISISYFPTNWEKYTDLKFHVFNPSTDTLKLTCRLHDKNHDNQYKDRFNKSYLIKPNWNEIIIKLEDIKNAPSKRKMDITQMKNFALFAVSLKERKTIYFDYLRLE